MRARVLFLFAMMLVAQDGPVAAQSLTGGRCQVVRHPAAGVEEARGYQGRAFRPRPHAATAKAVVSETSSHCCQRRRITVR
jgi:hypothetical protein